MVSGCTIKKVGLLVFVFGIMGSVLYSTHKTAPMKRSATEQKKVKRNAWGKACGAGRNGIVMDDCSVSRTTYVGPLCFEDEASIFLECTDTIKALAWSNNDQFIAVGRSVAAVNCESEGSEDTLQELLVLNASDLAVVAQVDYGSALNTQIRAVSWSTTTTDGTALLAVGGRTCAAPDNEELQLYRFNGSSLQLVANSRVSYSTRVNTVQWSPNGQFIAIGGNGSGTDRVRVYSFDGNSLYLVAGYDFGDTVKSLSWSPDSAFLAVGGDDTYVKVVSFDGASLTEVSSFDVNSSCVNSVAFHPSGNFVGVGVSSSFYLEEEESSFGKAIILGFDGVTLSDLGLAASSDASSVLTFAWSPGGDYFSYGSNLNLSSESHIYAFSFDGVSVVFEYQETFYDEIFANAWSHDARHFVFSAGTCVLEYSTNLDPSPSYNEALAQAPLGLTNIITTSGDHFWALLNFDLKFSSTEAAIEHMRGQWVDAGSYASLPNGSIKFLFARDSDENIYALDLTGKVHVATAVVIGPDVYITWDILKPVNGFSPSFVKLYQSMGNLYGVTASNDIYKYDASLSSGWQFVGTFPAPIFLI